MMSGLTRHSFDWIHFEGRNVEEVEKMLQLVKTNQISIKCSVELEKPRCARDGSNIVERLVKHADCIMCSEAYARGV